MTNRFQESRKGDRLEANIMEAVRQLGETPAEEWKDSDLAKEDGLLFNIAQELLLAKIRAEKDELEHRERLSAKWQEPGLVVAEKEFKQATDFLLKLHPDAQQAALKILASNIEQSTN